MPTFDKVILPNNQETLLNKLEKIYLIAKEYARKNEILFCIVGKPSAPVFQPIVDAEIQYWTSVDKAKPIEYGELQGDIEYRDRMAKALKRHYQNVEFHANDIIFTTGGRIGIQAISHLFSTSFAGKKIITTSFYYTDHTGSSYSRDETHDMVYVDVSDFKALNAESLSKSLEKYEVDEIGGFIFSDPNNPLGNVVGWAEWKKMMPIFEKYKGVPIVIDEAYAEMVFDGNHESLVTVASENVLNRIILLRSGTKGFSVSGERMAILVTKNQGFMNSILEYHASNLVHTPRSAQNAYTCAMENFNSNDQKKLALFYKTFIRNVERYLKKEHFNIQNENYFSREATFYVIGDFSEFLGKKMNEKALKYYVRDDKEFIENNIDVAMHLIFEYNIALMPLFFYGNAFNSGLLRITCSFKDQNECSKVHDVLRKMRNDLTKKCT
jgi:aspartate aminotransferase/aminotransferase